MRWRKKNENWIRKKEGLNLKKREKQKRKRMTDESEWIRKKNGCNFKKDKIKKEKEWILDPNEWINKKGLIWRRKRKEEWITESERKRIEFEKESGERKRMINESKWKRKK